MRTRIALVLALLVSVTALGAAAPAGATDEPAVPVSGTTTFTGHGFGHGRGLSQYGARGRAIKGQTAATILGFYFPGTALATTTGVVRVWLRGAGSAATVVLPRAGLVIADLGSGKVTKLPTTLGAKAWRLTGAGSTSGFTLSYQNKGWHAFRPGGKALVGYGEFRTKSHLVTVHTAGGDKTYRGGIQRRNKHTINRLALDAYVRGVVAAEMPSTWQLEALKSQAIAARTFAAYSRAASVGPTNTWDVDDSTNYQVYGGLGRETAATNQAVVQTAGKILTYAGAPAYTQFSSSDGGWTVAGATKPYLVASQDTFEQYASNPYASWTYAPTAAILQTKLHALAASARYGHVDIGTLTELQVVARDGHGQWGGRVTSIRLIGSKNSVVVDGSDLRIALSLRSTWFSLTD